MKRLLFLFLVLVMTSSASAQTRAPAPAATPQVAPAATSPLDGEWRGTSDGGSCNAPLDYVLFIEAGIVEGSAYETTARGPVPNPKKSAPPPPGPGLWQIHGVARSTGSFTLLSVASVKGTDRREGKLTGRAEGGGLVISENGGCRRTVRLTRR